MKKFTLSFWLALAAAGLLVTQTTSMSAKYRFDDPAPTCPPECPDSPQK